MLPVDDALHHDAVEVAEDARDLLAELGRTRGQHGADRARFREMRDRALVNPLPIVGDPVDERVAGGAERRGVERRLRRTAGGGGNVRRWKGVFLPPS